MKKIQAMTIGISYAIFAAIMVFTVFGRIYSNAMRTEGIYDFLNIFCMASILVFACILLFFKKPNKYILYFVTPCFVSLLINPYILLKHNEFQYLKNSTGFELIASLYFLLYIGTFIWLLSLFMFLLDFGLTRWLKPNVP